MVLGFLGKQYLVDAEAAGWLFDAFAWSLRHFGAEVFYRETRLVVPSNEYFPGREDSLDGMARLIFEHVVGYAGMRHWPLRLADQAVCSIPPAAPIEIRGALRGSNGNAPPSLDDACRLTVVYDPNLVRDPEALIASYAHALAHYLAQTAKETPPGGASYWPQATEVLAVFMGFGLMFANSAFNLQVRSCGSCGGPPVQRRSFLTQYESTYALAIFSVLKDVRNRDVLPHLKRSLRPFYRKCVKEIRGRREQLDRLRSRVTASVPPEAAAAPS
jgi:hypothetical protein